MGLYKYLKGSPVALADPFGTQSGSTQPATRQAGGCCCADAGDCKIGVKFLTEADLIPKGNGWTTVGEYYSRVSVSRWS
jgi:hypothetical protein